MFAQVAPPKYPGRGEQVAYSDYHKVEVKKSKLVNKMVKVNSRGTLNCPRYNETLPGLKHAEDTACPECNLHMQLYGNALFLWEGLSSTIVQSKES